MIQRIQSIFLLLAAASAFGLFGLPFGSTTAPVQTSSMFADSLYNIQDHMALLALFCLAGGLAFISIFLFNNRKSQLLVGRLAIVANIIGAILTIVFFMQEATALGTHEPAEELGLLLPVLFIVFALLAQRFIMKDEKLVRSMDRLR